MSPRVSVITPYLNPGVLLGEAIASVLAQTVNDWELILVNDGSTDNSAAIAAAFAERDAQIRLLTRPQDTGSNAAGARNFGLQCANGNFVAFLDADDVLEPHMLETVLRAAEDNPSAEMIYGPTRWWYPDNSRADWVEPVDTFAGKLLRPPQLLRRVMLLQDGHVPCTCSILVRRRVINDLGGFNERFKLYEDQTLWAKISLTHRIFVTPICLSKYRQHNNSASALASRQGLYDRTAQHPARAAFLDWLADYVFERGVSDARLLRALRLARAPYVEPATWQVKADRLQLAVRLRWAKYRRRLSRKLNSILSSSKVGG